MKPISLHGHEKSITQVCYNREGDLLFSCAKDKHPNVWYSINGERLGTYDGHGGAVWCLDVDWQTQHFLSGAADNTIRYFSCRVEQKCFNNFPSSRRICLHLILTYFF